MLCRYAPEHLIVNTEDAEDWLPMLENAGSIFLGRWTPESVGDYASGTNHVLPTYGYARMYSGVSLDSFQKKITVRGAAFLSACVACLACAMTGPLPEGLRRGAACWGAWCCDCSASGQLACGRFSHCSTLRPE